MNKDLIDLTNLTRQEISNIIDLALQIKNTPNKYSQALLNKTLLMIFAKPSLRTRVSFETAMTQLGGHAIYYDIATSPLGKKESIEDTAKCISRYVDIVMARLFDHQDILALASNSNIPVINGLTDFSHPCQILADLQTILESTGKLAGLKLAYFGDSNNNVTHSLLYGCALTGIHITVCCPQDKNYEPHGQVVKKAKAIAGKSKSQVSITHDPQAAAKDADIIYTDSWMSYHIPSEERQQRLKILGPFQVTTRIMSQANPQALFMNCLPAERGAEQTAEIIDGPQSIVFDQAENRLHAQKALLIKLLA